MFFFAFHKHSVRYTAGTNTFSLRETDESRYHNITLYNTSWREDRV